MKKTRDDVQLRVFSTSTFGSHCKRFGGLFSRSSIACCLILNSRPMYLSKDPVCLFWLFRRARKEQFFWRALFREEVWRFGVVKHWAWGCHLVTKRRFSVFGVRASEFTNGMGFMAGFLGLWGLNEPGLMDGRVGSGLRKGLFSEFGPRDGRLVLAGGIRSLGLLGGKFFSIYS